MTETTAAATKARSTKLPLIAASVVFAVLTLVSWTQDWFGVTLTDGTVLNIAGQVAAPALSALALTTLVLVGALSIAGPFFRVLFGVLEAVIGATVVLESAVALSSPITAAAPAISVATGVAGKESVASLVAKTTVGLWPVLALVSGVLIVACGLLILVTSRRWSGSSRKYQATRLEPADGAPVVERTSVDDWDSLSGGDDPTDAPEPRTP